MTAPAAVSVFFAKTEKADSRTQACRTRPRIKNELPVSKNGSQYRNHSIRRQRMKYTRRDFLKTTAACGIAAGAGPLLCSVRSSCAAAQPQSTLAVVQGARPAATRKAVQLLGGMEAFVKKDSRVVLKPNMSWASTVESAADTHPEVVREVAAMCIEAGASEVRVLDHTINRAEQCLKLSGIGEACGNMNNVYVYAVNDEKFYRGITIPRGKALRSVKIIKDVLDCDVFINLPCAKSHTTTGVTLGMKNLMGIIWDRRAFHSDFDINQALADLSSAVKVHLTVLDASRALTTAGPKGPGIVTEPRTIIAGTDPVAVDAMGVTMADWYGQKFTPKQIKHIAAAHAMGLGTMDLPKVNIKKAAV
jgi:uncharacterized protein (DUF362 family)